MDARGASVPAAGDAPDEAVRILTHLTQHRQVRGCVTLSVPDYRVLWSGGAAFAPGAAPDGDVALARVVQFVRELLDVAHRHIGLFDHDVRWEARSPRMNSACCAYARGITSCLSRPVRARF